GGQARGRRPGRGPALCRPRAGRPAGRHLPAPARRGASPRLGSMSGDERGGHETWARVRRPGEALARIEHDIRRSQAEALGRVGEALDRVLDRLRAMDGWLDRVAAEAPASPPAARRLARETAVRNRLREEALRLRHRLIIQREAWGLVREAPVEECYPVPGRRPGPAWSLERSAP